MTTKKTRTYTTRGMTEDTYKRIRILAAMKGVTIEAMVNEVLHAGLPVVEKAVFKDE